MLYIQWLCRKLHRKKAVIEWFRNFINKEIIKNRWFLKKPQKWYRPSTAKSLLAFQSCHKVFNPKVNYSVQSPNFLHDVRMQHDSASFKS